MNKKEIIFLGVILTFFAVLLLLRFTPLGEEGITALKGQSQLFVILVVVAALVDSINPCAFSVLLITIAFLFGFNQSRSRIFLFGGVYIAGIFTAYILIGIGILQAFAFFNIPNFIAKITAVILVGIGVLQLGSAFIPRFPFRFKIPDWAHRFIALLMQKRSLPALFVVGMLVGVSEFPCTGGPYLVILSLLHNSRSFVQGFWYLVFYNVLFVTPLVATLFVVSSPALVERVRTWRREHLGRSRVWEGALLVLLGLAILLFVY